jgi:hypothetical protein
MKSARDPWLFLIGYFISFVPVSCMYLPGLQKSTKMILKKQLT